MRKLLGVILLCCSLKSYGQETVRPNPLDDRGGLPIPKAVEDLQNLSLDFWLKFRKTNQNFYNYINSAADFRAYQHVCKRHELNVNIEPLTLLSRQYVRTVIPAHFTEPEFEILNTLSETEKTKFFDEMSGNILSFEYGRRIVEIDTKIRDSGKSKVAFCKDIEPTYKGQYIALLATAQRRLK